MGLADLRGLPLLSLKDAESRSYSPLKIGEGMTLISCSGSVGKMVFARPDMAGMTSAGDIMKVQPNSEAILPGYLFAYLSCKIGHTLVSSGTYGTIIPHLEPQHIADIPVPRLGDQIEQRVHQLMEKSSGLISKYARMVNDATGMLFDAVGLNDISPSEWEQPHGPGVVRECPV